MNLGRARSEAVAASVRAEIEAGIPAEVRAWPGSRAIVAKAEHRLAAVLLAWEMSGETLEEVQPELDDALGRVARAWKDAAAAYRAGLGSGAW